MDDLIQVWILIVVGFLAGVINTLAGGGSLLPSRIDFYWSSPNVCQWDQPNRDCIQALWNCGISLREFQIFLSIVFRNYRLYWLLIGAQIACDIDGAIFNRILAIIMLIVVALLF